LVQSEPDASQLVSSIPAVEFEAPDLSGVCVLVVEDDDDARALVKRLLTDRNASVTTASSASQALDLLDTAVPHLLISDIGMPEMDGYEFIKRVRAVHPDPGRLP